MGKANLNNTQHPENIPVNLLTTISGTNGINSTALIQQTKNTNNTKFIDNIYQVLSFFKEGVRVFQHFLSKSNVSKVLKDGKFLKTFIGLISVGIHSYTMHSISIEPKMFLFISTIRNYNQILHNI